MISKIFKTLFWMFLFLMFLPPAPGRTAPSAPTQVFVSILPQKEIVQQIGRDLVTVQVMVPPGASPHTYEPKPAQMAALAQARIYFSAGVPFEEVWLPKFRGVNRRMQVVPTDRGIDKRPISAHSHVAGDHDASRHSLDPHIWLSPPLIKQMAATIREALKSADPAHAGEIDRYYANYLHKLDALDQRIRNMLADRRNARFMVFHPSWGYFADTYGLVQVPIEIQGKEPKPAQLQSLIEQARKTGIRVIFAQPQFSMRSAQMIAGAVGARVITTDPLPARLMDELLHLAEAIKMHTKDETR